MKKMIGEWSARIMMWVFILRPIIDLFYNVEIFMGANLAGVISVGLIGLSALYVVTGNYRYTGNAPRYILCAYATVMTVVYFIGNPNAGISDLQNYLRLLSTLSVLIILIPNLDRPRFHFMIRAFMIVTLVPLFISFLQVAGVVEYTYWDFIGGYIWRASGGYRQPSHLTRYLVFGIIYALYVLADRDIPWKEKMAYYLYIWLAYISILFTYHRTSYLCLVVLCVFYLIYLYFEKSAGKIKEALMFIILLAATAIVIYQMGLFQLDVGGFSSLLGSNNIVEVNSEGVAELNLRGRGDIIRYVFDSLKMSPIAVSIFGVGGYVNGYVDGRLTAADMDALALLWNYGVIGVCIWAVEVVSWFVFMWKNRNILTLKFRPMILLSAMSIVIYGIFGLTIEANYSPNFMFHVLLSSIMIQQLSKDSDKNQL